MTNTNSVVKPYYSNVLRASFFILMCLFMFFSFEKNAYAGATKVEDLKNLLQNFEDFTTQLEVKCELEDFWKVNKEYLNRSLEIKGGKLKMIAGLKNDIKRYEEKHVTKDQLLQALLWLRLKNLEDKYKKIFVVGTTTLPNNSGVLKMVKKHGMQHPVNWLTIDENADTHDLFVRLIRYALYLPNTNNEKLSPMTLLLLDMSCSIHDYLKKKENFIGDKDDAIYSTNKNKRVPDMMLWFGYGFDKVEKKDAIYSVSVKVCDSSDVCKKMSIAELYNNPYNPTLKISPYESEYKYSKFVQQCSVWLQVFLKKNIRNKLMLGDKLMSDEKFKEEFSKKYSDEVKDIITGLKGDIIDGSIPPLHREDWDKIIDNEINGNKFSNDILITNTDIDITFQNGTKIG